RSDRHDPRLDQLLAALPPRLRSGIQWLLLPSSTWIRIPAGALLICGGVLSFLPILGLWMLPLGLLLLAEDVPPLRSTRTRGVPQSQPTVGTGQRRLPSQITPSMPEVMYIIIFLCLISSGPGQLSIDHWIAVRSGLLDGVSADQPDT